MKKGQVRQTGTRPLRVGEEIRHVLADILGRGDLRDEDLAGRPITVTEVSVSPDLRNATAYVMPLGGRDVAIVLAALKRAAPFLRGEVARRIRLRFAPNLRFALDERFDSADRVEKILHSPAVVHDLDDDSHAALTAQDESATDQSPQNRAKP